jgi:prophage regulatory protein
MVISACYMPQLMGMPTCYVGPIRSRDLELESNVPAVKHEHMPGSPRLIRIAEVLRICGLSRATLYREIKAKQFPAPLKISARSVGWLQDEVMGWVASRVILRASQSNEAVQAPPQTTTAAMR